ncbi:unnamed protein product [Caenorhabditis nigoni]
MEVALRELIQSLKCLFKKLGAGFTGFFQEMAPSTGNFIKALFGNLPDILDVLEKLVDNLSEGNFDGVIDAITELPLAFGLKTTLQTVLTSGEALLMDLINVWAKLENDPVKKCIEDVLDGLAETGEFSEEVVNQARDKLSTFEDCDSPIKCIFGLSRSMAQSTISDAANFSNALNKGLRSCSDAFPACNLFIRRVSVCSKLTTPLPTEAPPSTETTQVPVTTVSPDY